MEHRKMHRVAGVLAPLLACVCFGLLAVLQQRNITLPETTFNLAATISGFAILALALLRWPGIQARFYDGIVNCDLRYWIIYGVAGYVVMHGLADTLFGRRLLFFFWFSQPAIAVFPVLWRRFAACRLHDRLAIFCAALMLTVLLIPGFYFPPFFGGIAGWTAQIGPVTRVELVGFKLVRKDGESVWVTPGLTSPTSLNWRQVSAARDAGLPSLAEYLDFIFRLYERDYHQLSSGRDMNQRYFGSYSYPGHNSYHQMPYGDFRPEDIAYIAYFDEARSRTNGELLRRSISLVYDPRAKNFVDATLLKSLEK